MIKRPNLFEQPWWLDITAPGNWRKLAIDTSMGEVVFTYAMRERSLGIIDIYKPGLTPYIGFSSEDMENLTIGDEHQVLTEAVPKIVRQLPAHNRFIMNFPPSFEWWSPFFWEGFKQTTKYTYQLVLSQGQDILWQGLNSNARRNINKARKTLVMTESNRGSELYSLFSTTMQAQGKSPGYPETLLKNICNAVYEHNSGKVLIASDEEGRPHAGLLVVWHNRTAWYLVGGSDPLLRKSGAMMWLMWNAIELAMEHADLFDFEGSMQKGIQQFLRNFNALPVPYFQIYRPFRLRKY